MPFMTEGFDIIGNPIAGGVLIVADHASNHVPAAVDLGIDIALLNQHIAWDIGVAGVAECLVSKFGFSGILGGVSRLVNDLNRYSDEDAVISQCSDGIEIRGNILSAAERSKRLEQYYYPYHRSLKNILASTRPALILSLHSFTPQLKNKPEELRPWEIGVLYNQDDRAARIAIPLFNEAGLITGDQLPYSGKLLNATMNLHAESNGIPYLGVEMRQDLVDDIAGQARFASILGQICQNIIEKLALSAAK
jgi:predicted N-formylglutamate amidohydrolase